MSLQDFAVDGADVASLTSPFRDRVLRLCEFFDGLLTISSGFRTYAQQLYLWNLYGSPRAARPGTSNHETGDAVDFRINDTLTWAKVHLAAPMYGLCFPLSYEDWHCEADPAWEPAPAPPPKDDDMNKQEFADAIGAVIAPDGDEFAGKVCVPLAVDRNGKLTGEFKLYPFASAVSYTHQEMKYARLGTP
jgi:hypothetical protein